ncbi:PepSY-like domain-containing protein [Lacihabitans soyangensis]|nr:PepSY-like domain-containing protein [Lacihabitans soyangensis]
MKTFRNFGLSFLTLVVLTLTSCEDSLLSPDDSSAVFSGLENASGDGVKVSASSLPGAITLYLNTNYPGKTITKAEKYLTKFEVTLSDLTKLEFSLSGVFIEVSGGSKNGTKVSDDTMAALPQVILDYIAKNYPGVTIVKAEKSSDKYEVKLSNRVRLDFSLSGKLVRVRTW